MANIQVPEESTEGTEPNITERSSCNVKSYMKALPDEKHSEKEQQ